jgi:hypothetical protein
MTHVPGPVKTTTPVAELTVQPDVDVPSTLKVTGLPEPPPVANTVYVAPGNGLVGGVLVKVITWGTREIVPLSRVVAGAASAELTLALLEKEPDVVGVTGTDIAGSAVPAARGTVNDPVYVHDTS